MAAVLALHVREGDKVRAGQVLIEIDDREARAQLSKIRAGLQEAEQALEEAERSTRAAEASKAAADAQRQFAAATLKRYTALLERKSASAHEFEEMQARYRVAAAEAERAAKMIEALNARRDQARARIEQAKADLESAEVNAAYSKIRSPINGIVTNRQTDIGQIATPGSPLMTVEDVAHYRLEVVVEESRSHLLRPGERTTVSIDGISGGEFDARVLQIVPTSDPASRSSTVKIELPGEAVKMGARSGMFGRAYFVTGQKQALIVPRAAIVDRGQIFGVHVLDGSGTARWRIVKVGRTYPQGVEILSGLSEGEEIVTGPPEAVADGSRVR
jgi:multidrug resistance efflux pump